jgi:hypothetical protein
MTTTDQPIDPDEYVREHRETLVEIIKHGTDPFVRAFALAALVEYGEEPDLDRVRHELDRATERGESA